MAARALHPLLIVCGPTSSGKSDLALSLARHCHGEIINCDSLQIYRGLDIGTAKTPPAQRAGIPHHLFDILPPHQVFSAGAYASAARAVIAEITSRGNLPVVTGGTGFYLKALLNGLTDGPTRDDNLRRRLSQRESRRTGSLHRLLVRFDPATAARIHSNDLHKTIRALEICMLARRPASQLFVNGALPLEGYQVLKIGLAPPRPLLHQRIAARTRAIFDAGLVGEVKLLLAQGVPPTAKAFESIGYKEALSLIQGHLTLPQAVELTTIATRQYAKRQMTWFRREPAIHWFPQFGDSTAALAQSQALLASEFPADGKEFTPPP